jgi:nucleotide-binding universal stress UspA family protein
MCTDGSSDSARSAELISRLKFSSSARITILGVNEGKADIDKITASIEYITEQLGARFKVSSKIRTGNPIEEILSEALEESYDLVAVAGGKSQLGLLHQTPGTTTSKLARKLHTHFLVARNTPEFIQKILVCTGADTPSSETIRLGGEWISNTAAQVGILHVLPIGGESIKAGAKIDTDGRDKLSIEKLKIDLLIEQATEQLRNAGVKNELIPLIRHGLVVEEVLTELVEGRYELLVIGAHYQPGQDLWQGTLLDDVTDQLLNRSNCSVLII